MVNLVILTLHPDGGLHNILYIDPDPCQPLALSRWRGWRFFYEVFIGFYEGSKQRNPYRIKFWAICKKKKKLLWIRVRVDVFWKLGNFKGFCVIIDCLFSRFVIYSYFKKGEVTLGLTASPPSLRSCQSPSTPLTPTECVMWMTP